MGKRSERLGRAKLFEEYGLLNCIEKTYTKWRQGILKNTFLAK
jgi:hypothetical protein